MDDANETDLEELRLVPEAFRRDHVAEDADAELRGLVFLLDQQAAAPPVQRLRGWTLQALAPQPGDTAVDVGAGTGEEAQRLGSAVGPGGRAVAVEPHPGLRAVAAERVSASGVAVELVDGDALALPFDDGSVDVLRCERVWQHLTDPAAAAAEVARVLAPGGRAAVVDSDWASAVQWPGDPDVLRRLWEAGWAEMANPFAGRHLRRLLAGAGLEVDADIGSAALVMPDEVLRRSPMLTRNLDRAVAVGAVTREEADALHAETMAAVDARTAFFAVTMFSVVARR